jgi:hypothetical protein
VSDANAPPGILIREELATGTGLGGVLAVGSVPTSRAQAKRARSAPAAR